MRVKLLKIASRPRHHFFAQHIFALGVMHSLAATALVSGTILACHLISLLQVSQVAFTGPRPFCLSMYNQPRSNRHT